MTAAVVRTPAEFEERLRHYLYERSEEARAVRVGEKETSDQAAIVARYADLFSREQVAALREAESSAQGDLREQLYRLRSTCEGGIITTELAARGDALENAQLAARLTFKGEEMPLRTAQAKLAVVESYGDRDELGALQGELSATFNEGRLDLIRAGEALEAELSGDSDPVHRSEDEKGISLFALADALEQASAAVDGPWQTLRDRWFDRLLGGGREAVPASVHSAWMRRLSPLESTYTKEKGTQVCMDTLLSLGFDLTTLPNIRLDIEDRPQKSPRACVIASDPPEVVHLITRAQGGLHDYQAFLHEAGHALHYGCCDPALPYTFRKLSRDHALTEIYSYICEAITREPEWHKHHFGLSTEEARMNAEATTFLEALLFRRYVAKLRYELGFWTRFPTDGGTNQGYADTLGAAVGLRYRPDAYLADMDAGFYSADYLRAWIRSAQLRTFLVREVGEDWWRNPKAGVILRDLFFEGTRPSSEEIAKRLGFAPLDTAPLVHELS